MANCIDDGRYEYLITKRKHPLDGFEIDVKGGTPRNDKEAPKTREGDIKQLLPGQTPIGITL